MRWWSGFIALLVVLPPSPQAGAESAGPAAEITRIAPPAAARRPIRLTAHGIERVDDYAWLRDPNWRDVVQDPTRLAPEIRAYIEAENAYAQAALAPPSGLRVQLVEEMEGRT